MLNEGWWTETFSIGVYRYIMHRRRVRQGSAVPWVLDDLMAVCGVGPLSVSHKGQTEWTFPAIMKRVISAHVPPCIECFGEQFEVLEAIKTPSMNFTPPIQFV